ncbi:MAG: RIP metalloprotease RseP [bacterium]|jgi:regulator of sigma E protease
MVALTSIIIFGLLVFIHELGHFLAAKSSGILVEEFSLGLGPKIMSVQRGGTDYGLRLFPLGGFVRMAGDGPEPVDSENAFNRKSVWQRMRVIAAGPAMNFLLAAVMFSLLIYSSGIPTGNISTTTEIGEIVLGEPADTAGLLPGDRIAAIDGVPVETWDDLVEIISASPGEQVELTIRRDSRTINLAVTPKEREDGGRGWIGITPSYEVRHPGIWEAVGAGFRQMVYVTSYIFTQLVRMIARQAPADLTGPLGVAQIIGRAARLGFLYVLNIAAVINVNIGLFNLIPIPALDGSRLFFLLTEAVRGRPVDPEKENFFHLVGFALLMVFAVFILYRDAVRIWF